MSLLRSFAVGFATLAGPAAAHTGHLAAAGGHDHVLAGIALGIALGIAGWSVLKGLKKKAATEAEDDAETPAEDGEEAAA